MSAVLLLFCAVARRRPFQRSAALCSASQDLSLRLPARTLFRAHATPLTSSALQLRLRSISSCQPDHSSTASGANFIVKKLPTFAAQQIPAFPEKCVASHMVLLDQPLNELQLVLMHCELAQKLPSSANRARRLALVMMSSVTVKPRSRLWCFVDASAAAIVPAGSAK